MHSWSSSGSVEYPSEIFLSYASIALRVDFDSFRSSNYFMEIEKQ